MFHHRPSKEKRFHEMTTYTEQLQRLANQYMSATGSIEFTTRDVAAWAISEGLWQPQPALLIKQCAEELARAMREEIITDPQGRRVRVKHVAWSDRGGEQTLLWADMRLTTREHMQGAFQLRRKQIVGDCRQLKIDVDSYNQNYNSGKAIQLVLDFTDDVAELEKRPV
jgi:hypothetical protein